MEDKTFLEIINKEASQYNLKLKYNPADGFEVEGNKQFGFVEFDFKQKLNKFCITFKCEDIGNTDMVLRCIQELSETGAILDILNKTCKRYKKLNPFVE